MKTRLALCIINLFLATFMCCKNKASDTDKIKPGQYIPINFSDPEYQEAYPYAKDTITPNGWSIQYLVKNDSTRYQDIYIRWSKGDKNGIYKGEDVLTFRPYFIPVFKGENQKHLFFTHACATSCKALLTLSKSAVPAEKTFDRLADYNISFGQVVYLGEYSEARGNFAVVVVDLDHNREKKVYFKNFCFASNDSGGIDHVQFQKDRVKIFATLTDRNDPSRSKNVTEIIVADLGK